MKINIKGIIIALIIMLILNFVFGLGRLFIFVESFPSEDIEAILKTTNPLIYSLFFGTISIIVAGYIAAKYEKEAPYQNSLVIGILALLSGFFFIENDPMWFNISRFSIVIPSALLGGYFFSRTMHEKTKE